MYINEYVPEYVKQYDEVYDVLQEQSEEYKTNLSGIYNEYGIEYMFEDNYINSPKYKYELTYDEENNRIADFSGNGFSMIATENKDNEKNFNKYIKEIKLLYSVDVLQDYFKVALMFMFALTFAQLNLGKRIKGQM